MPHPTPIYYYVCATGHRTGTVRVIRFRFLETALRAIAYARRGGSVAHMGAGELPDRL